MERGKPTLHLVSQLIHSLVSQLQRAAPLVNMQSVLLARSQSHPKNLPLGAGGREVATSVFRNTSRFLQKRCVKGIGFFDCLFVLVFEKNTYNITVWKEGEIKTFPWVLALVSILIS